MDYQFLSYFNQKFHNTHEAWTAEKKVLFMNSIGNTNNVCEIQVKLLEETASDRVIQRIDYIITPLEKGSRGTLEHWGMSPFLHQTLFFSSTKGLKEG